MTDTPQNLYAKELQQLYGYPLRFPEPKPSLPSSYTEYGLQIGDVGYVTSDGLFEVLFNICFPPDHELNSRRNALDGLVGLAKFDSKEAPPLDGIVAGRAVCHGIQGSQGDNLKFNEGAQFKFKSCSKSGAILILPSGAALQKLMEDQEEEFRELAEKHAPDWCRIARRNSIYLITGFYKTSSWYLASFHDVKPTGQVLLERDVAGSFTCDARCDFRHSHKDNSSENQTVFISGFKIQVRDWDKRILVEKLSPHPKGIWSALTWLASFLFGIFTLIVFRIVVRINPVPALLPPFHPADSINRYLLVKNPNVQVAITHDSKWLNMIKKNELSLEEMADEGLFWTFLEENYTDDQNSDNVVYLQRKSEPHNEDGKALCKYWLSRKRFTLSPVSDDTRQLVITHIRAENVVARLRRMPVGFYVVIQSNGMKKGTKCKPALLHDNTIEWDEAFVLPADPMVDVQFSIVASFEFEPLLGNGETLCMLETSMGELTESGSSYLLCSRDDEDTSRPSLLITLEEQNVDLFSGLVYDNKTLGCKDSMSAEIAKETDQGHNALLHYYEGRGLENLKECVEHFRRASIICPFGHDYFATTLTNHATATFIKCQTHGTTSELDMAINSYRKALTLRSGRHPDRPGTLLYLAQALLYSQRRLRWKESVVDEIEGFVTEIKEICPESSYENRAAGLVVQTLNRFRVLASGTPAELNELVKELDLSARMLPNCDFDKPHRMINLNVTLRKRFKMTTDPEDLTKSISVIEEAVRLVPHGHFDKPWMLASLADGLHARFLHSDDVDDLAKSVTMMRDAVKLVPDDHSDKPWLLVSLGKALRARLMRCSDIADLDGSISIIQDALELIPDGHFDKPWILASLGDVLHIRFVQRGDIDGLKKSISMIEDARRLAPGDPERLFLGDPEDLGDAAMSVEQYYEAVYQYSVALLFNPAVRARILIKRSRAWMAKKLWEDALSDADEAIALDPSSPWGYQTKHAVLHGAKRFVEAIEEFETMLSQMEQSPDPATRELRDQYISPSTTRAHIQTAVQQAGRHLPRVLIDTSTGRLKDGAEQASSFESTPIYSELLSSMTTSVDDGRIKDEVRRFFRYVMLSHEWEENEPLFEDVIQAGVYDLDESPAHDKLKSFCKIVQDSGFNWAWSDTCCIDKRDHSAYEEALTAMFRWYRDSAMVIVHLQGVRSPAEFRDLMRSIWNTRSWTLMEYIAAKVILFYTEDWKLYRDIEVPNHKEAPEIVSEMEQATGFSAKRLEALLPGLSDIREKLQLASTRQSTRIEDEAYSLFGIFSVEMPIVYGERGNALGRLLILILLLSGDISVLAWTGQPGAVNSCLPARIGAYSSPATSHLPLRIDVADMENAVATLRGSTLDVKLAIKLYDRLNELPKASFATGLMKLPCIAFKLPPLLPYETRSGRIYRAETTALGVVEIRAQLDPFHLESLYLIHPWLNDLLGREPITASVRDDVAELSSQGALDNKHANVQNSGSSPNRKSESTSSPAPVDGTVSPDREMHALQLVTRLRQPFGGLLFVQALREEHEEYWRVASDGLITVQIQQDIPLDELLENVRILDVL